MDLKSIVVGILAHVDAGKTTLSESMLYLSGMIRHLGRVDHGDAFLDYNDLERKRGITIFSKQAQMNWKDTSITLIDTPGHADFSAEMERTLQVLDYAIVVISGIDGVQTHSETIKKLLEHYHIPTFIFVNKMDLASLSQEELLNDLQENWDEHCIIFHQFDDKFYESAALCDEKALEEYLEHQTMSTLMISQLIQQRKMIPVIFGSALKMQGVQEFLDILSTYTCQTTYPSQFQAQVYKVTHDSQGQLLTHMKVMGGTLKNKSMIHNEKIDEIRIYSGLKYELVQSVNAGNICAVKGPKLLQPGMTVGTYENMKQPILSSYMNYRIVFQEECNQYEMFQNLQQLAQEEPSLHLQYDSESSQIHVQLMGDIQIEVLKHLIKERFHEDVSFDQGEILYKETISDTVEGVGHFEPLRHYAEVHVLLEPGERGSGVIFESQVSEDVLDRHWQRLILTHLQEKEHIGVLTGSPITDMKITLVNGKAHQKHTEGGDFREATYRAVRHGLKKAQSVLLEPYYQFQLEIPQNCLSRALYDIDQMNGTVEVPSSMSEMLILKGEAPISQMQNYQSEVISYTKGKGRLYCTLSGYQPCAHQEEIIKKIHYSSEEDIQNPTGSIFCSHGAGFYVPYNKVEQYMHLPLISQTTSHYHKESYSSSLAEDDELEAIFTRTYGPIERKKAHQMKSQRLVDKVDIVPQKPQCLLVDGYNVIHAWDELRDIAKTHLEGARLRLMDMMCNYQGYKNCVLILVFDAYKVKGNLGSIQKYHNIYVVYTKEAQTADMYIERVTHQMSSEYQITVATSDALEQLIVTGAGAYRMSSRDLKHDLDYMNQVKQEEYRNRQEQSRNFLLEDIKKYGNEK